MYIYNFLFLCHHNFDFVVLIIQFPVVQKFNQNVMTQSPPFNLKQTYQTCSIYPFFLLLSKTYIEQNVLQIFIVTLLCKSKDIPNLIIQLSLDFLSSKVGNHYLLSFVFLLSFLFKLWTFSKVYSYVGSFYCDGLSCCCYKSSHSLSSSKLEMEIGATYSFMPTFLL